MKNSVELRISLCVMILVAATTIPGLTLGQASTMIDPNRQFQFAESYFARGEYYRAIGEYERFIYFFPQDSRAELAKYKIGLSYFRGKKLQQAIRSFTSLIGEYHDTELSVKSYVKMSECYVELKAFRKALGTLDNLLKIAADDDLKDEALYRQGWIYLEMDEWEKARDSFDRISPKNRDVYRLKELSEGLSEKELLKTKTPATAGALAAVPGAGHIYCERYQDALLAFLLNGAMILAAYEAFDNDNEALGGLITFFEIGLYAGNIYSAVNSAHKYNRKQKRDFLQYLKEHFWVGASTGRIADSQVLAVSVKFAF